MKGSRSKPTTLTSQAALRDDHLTRLRVCQAQYLVISTGLEVSRIAFETGFGSLNRFYEAFKAVSGRSPRRP